MPVAASLSQSGGSVDVRSGLPANHLAPSSSNLKRKASDPCPLPDSSAEPLVPRRSARIASRQSSTGSSSGEAPSVTTSTKAQPNTAVPSSLASNRSLDSAKSGLASSSGVHRRYQPQVSQTAAPLVNLLDSQSATAAGVSSNRLRTADPGSADQTKCYRRSSCRLRNHVLGGPSLSSWPVSSAVFVPQPLPTVAVATSGGSSLPAPSASLSRFASRSYYLRGSAASSTGSSLPFAVPTLSWSVSPAFNLGNSGSSNSPAGGPPAASSESSSSSSAPLRRSGLPQLPAALRRSQRSQRPSEDGASASAGATAALAETSSSRSGSLRKAAK